MPTWSEILNESDRVAAGNPQAATDYIVNLKKDYIRKLSEKTGRNVILYFSSFLGRQPSNETLINDLDINAFMENVHGLDKTKGLDLILHTPGGDLSATEQIIKYLRSCFGGKISSRSM